MNESIPLRHLPTGHVAEVSELIGQTEQVRRLQELGFQQGSTVEMVQPGSPCIVRLGEKRIGFRASDLAHVLVKPRVAV